MGNLFELGQKCIKAEYEKIDNSSVVSVLNSGQFIFNNQPVAILANATASNVTGRLDVHFPAPFATGEYNVIDTDYKNWATVFSCVEVHNLTSLQFGWVLSR